MTKDVINNINVIEYKQIISPNILFDLCSNNKKNFINENIIFETRNKIRDILKKKTDKKIVIVGPCSIHDLNSAKEYGHKLKNMIDKYEDTLTIIMRVYFEKPRTTVGWKGLINDPDLNGSYNINKGLTMARTLLVYLNSIGVPCGCEFLDTTTPQYIADLVSWGAIGARTTESQVHRQLTSGLSMPIGFKNGTSGNKIIARDAIISASQPHSFLGITKEGSHAIIVTKGNKDCHIILRGSNTAGPNYEKHHIEHTENIMLEKNIIPNIIIDCSHGNSEKNYKNQPIVLDNICDQISNGSKSIIGVMIESNLNEGNQKLTRNPDDLEYGISITDSCVNWNTTELLLKKISESVVKSRILMNNKKRKFQDG